MATWLWRNKHQLTMPKFGEADSENMRAVERAINLLPIVPTAFIGQWPLTNIPEGWLECDGSAVSRGTYRDLFTAIGTTFGTGDGSTTFNVPDLAGRVVVGLDTADAAFDAMGETGGAATHTLTSAEMPSHTHTQNSHTHGPGAGTVFVNVGGAGGFDIPAGATDYPQFATTAATTAVNQNTGGGGAHANLQPYITLKNIIKT